MSFEVDLQAAIYTELTNNAPLMALVVGVYDDVEQVADSGNDASYPFVVIGEDIYTDWSTDTTLGAEVNLSIHTWSRYRGRKEVKQIHDAIYTALNRINLVINNQELTTIDFVQSQSFLDSDALTRHGVIEFRLLFDTVTP